MLYKYILNLFGCKDLEALSRDLKDLALESVDDERLRVGAPAGIGVSHFYYALKQHKYDLHIPQEKLFEYDKNIVRHTKEINERRPEKIQWKYYQYLALLFTEVYLDRYFSGREALRQSINSFLRDDFNFRTETSKQGRGSAFAGKTIEVIDINKLAETDGDKTVAVESFEGNDLVLVDEGHKGSGGEVWRGYRNTLPQEGFSFEYSATWEFKSLSDLKYKSLIGRNINPLIERNI